MGELERLIRAEIAASGPMAIDRYMGLSLGHPVHGYYMAQEPFGEEGDFITAPEISQVFGELIGFWCIGQWQAMGAPDAFNLIELGPGRGTLMADMLRAAAVSPPFLRAARVHLVETSPRLTSLQQARIGPGATWHHSLDDVPEAPFLLVANELFDALPIRQFLWRDGGWRERAVALVDGALVIVTIAARGGYPPENGEEGDIAEVSPAREEIARAIGARLKRHKGSALIVDYGHLRPGRGDTLQALSRHSFTAITRDPGLCDMTSHVDFAALAQAIVSGGGCCWPAMTQGNFLRAMGLEARFAALAAGADGDTAEMLARARARLADRDQMGNLFKILAATSPEHPLPYPFGAP
ncbi:MAG: class I SAM-dependent methyltransferase [Alphaproteobacteria bacterium]|nr:class I SAM-dependent methyltransferase [Alphaproteobacteria bacterium]